MAHMWLATSAARRAAALALAALLATATASAGEAVQRDTADDLYTKFAMLKARTKNLKEELTAAEETIAGQAAELALLQTELGDLKQAADATTTQLTALQKAMDGLLSTPGTPLQCDSGGCKLGVGLKLQLGDYTLLQPAAAENPLGWLMLKHKDHGDYFVAAFDALGTVRTGPHGVAMYGSDDRSWRVFVGGGGHLEFNHGKDGWSAPWTQLFHKQGDFFTYGACHCTGGII